MIVDDEVLIREGLRRIVDGFDGTRVVAVCTGSEAVDGAREHRPDVVLLDVRMPDRDGLAVLADLRALPDPPVVAMLTMFDVDEHLAAALRGGAAGFLLKDTAPDQLAYLIKELAEGGRVIAPKVARTVVDGYLRAEDGGPEHRPAADRPGAAGRPGAGGLTPREREVLVLLAEGLSNSEIARRLRIGTTTVKDHVSTVLGKLGVANRVQAAVRAHQLRLV
ncbi:response regulator transcription factor [Streptomyces somaliensis]|uniref:response regulator n=1 Tax=Streptomyces somaliensis TaxID=78355 RepID=UPI0020CCD350|nr:response regulator transcription factor [Streptomyces somaliensis]MCP9944614.1 response regulator transcription factor [Streptomyces somaliensis]MCP9962162.1 response regulator transcription factor [Streptomyces somaliensis]MCP9974978.1 response regulator transcription factor [Streptomyces somaliensis]